VAKTKELKKRSWGMPREDRVSSVLEAVSRASGSPFSAYEFTEMGGGVCIHVYLRHGAREARRFDSCGQPHEGGDGAVVRVLHGGAEGVLDGRNRVAVAALAVAPLPLAGQLRQQRRRVPKDHLQGSHNDKHDAASMVRYTSDGQYR